MELLESNNLLAGWSGFELRSTPLQSKKITGAELRAELRVEPRAGVQTCRCADVQTFVRAINYRDICRDDSMGVHTGVCTGDCRTFLIY